MTRDELVTDQYELEVRKLKELSEDFILGIPKAGCEQEWKECSDRIDILDQMLNEICMDHFEQDKMTGLKRQVFVGKILEEPEVYIDVRDPNFKHYFIKVAIMNCGDEDEYKDVRLLRVSKPIMIEWFFNNPKYTEEREQRIKKGQSTYVRVSVIDGEVRKLRWCEE